MSLLRTRTACEDEAPSALLLRIATNVCLNRMRTERRHPEDADDELLLRIAAGRRHGRGDRPSRGTVARNLLAQAVPHRRSAGGLDADHRGHAPGRRHDAGRGRARGGAVGLGRPQAPADAARPPREELEGV